MKQLIQPKQVYSKTYVKRLYRRLRKQHRLSKAKAIRLKTLLFQYCNKLTHSQAKKIAASIALTLSLNVSTHAQQNFAPPVENPFGLTTTNQFQHRSFADIDADGDMDMIETGKVSGTDVKVYLNIGTGANPVFNNPLVAPWGLTGAPRGYGQLIDLDADGDLDFLASESNSIFFYENIGSSSSPNFASRVTNPFNLTNTLTRFTFDDVDADGDFDMVALNRLNQGQIYEDTVVRLFENIGSSSSPNFANPVNRTRTEQGYIANLALCDMDNDGDLEVLIPSFYYAGSGYYSCYYASDEKIRYFINEGSASNFDLTQFAFGSLDNPLTSCEGRESISSTDIDLDGDMDVFGVGEYSGINYFYENLAVDRTCSENIFNSEDLEMGFGIWNDGGRNCLISNRVMYANSGRKSIRLVARNFSSHTTTDELDLSPYGTVSVDFSYIVRSYEGNESFLFQMSEDGGPFTTIKSFNPGVDFENDQRKFVTININGPLSNQTKFRIRSRAYRRDYVYIDDITIHACVVPNPVPKIVVNDGDKFQDKNQNTIQIYPNPNNGLFTLVYEAKESAPINLNVFDLQGKLLFSKNQKVEKGLQKIEMDVMHLDNGFYFLQISDGEQTKIQKFYKNSRS